MNNRSYPNAAAQPSGPTHIVVKQTFLWWNFQIPLLWNIYGSHVKRLGFTRVLFGGSSMYLTLPFFILLHITGLVLLVQHLLTPLLGLPKRELRNYIVIDRYKIAGLTVMDKINCMFCGYANGMIHFLNSWLDEFAASEAKPAFPGAIILPAVMLPYFPILILMQEMTLLLIFSLCIAWPLGFVTMDRHTANATLATLPGYTGKPGLAGWLLRYEKIFALRFSHALAQIESAWCPLKHLDRRPGVSYPAHHGRFFEPDEVSEMLQTLANDGSVMRR